MAWSEIRKAYPNTWLVIEAVKAHSDAQQRVLDRIAVVETCADGASAFESYQQLHQEHPWREMYYVHMGREALDIRERPIPTNPKMISFFNPSCPTPNQTWQT